MVDTRSPVLTALLFRPLAGELIGLLRGLDAEAWERPTSAGEWRVRDVAAHLLDVDLRRLSAARDAYAGPVPDRALHGYTDLVAWLDTLNATWVDASRRLSPRVLTELIAFTAPAVAALMETTDPRDTATFPVAWAGDEERSPMWLDIGREYTERWHHQDQIREAVGAPALGTPDLLRPVIEISLLALPRAYAQLQAAVATCVALEVSGAAGGAWYIEHRDGWRLRTGVPLRAAARVRAADLDLARLLLHRLDARAIEERIEVEGDVELARPLLAARAVMV